MEAPVEGVAAAVLVGGRSSRMGRDKALLALEGRPVVAHVVEAARAAVRGPFALVARAGEAEPYRGLLDGVELVEDGGGERSALAGIEGALAWSPEARVLVLACDLPRVPAALLVALASLDPAADVAAVEGPRGLEPLVAVYSRRCLAAAREAMARGGWKATAFHAGLVVRSLGGAALEAVDPEGGAFRNLNTPEEFERISALRPPRGRV